VVKAFKNDLRQTQVLNSYNRILAEWSVDFQEQDVDGKYGTTHCIISGSPEKPPLLLFHGVGDNSAIMWLLNMKELSRHFYCIAVDTIGGPGKSIPNTHYKKGAFDQVEWINEIADHYNIDNFHIAGVSNGAYMAYNYTTVNSDRVNKAVCMEGGMVTKPVKTMIQTLLLMFPHILIPTDRNLLKIIKKLSSPNSTIFNEHPLLAEHLVLLMKSHNQQAMFAHKIEGYDRAKGVAVRDKLYFLMGEHQMNLRGDLMRILDDGGFRYKIIPDAGHGINHERPGIINEEIVQFLLEE
jgi:Predicted hydrolases or acyltransferases (alpha/beta hydrolase superfamily)